MAEKRVVYLTFSTIGGKSTSVTISAPRAGITLQDAKTAVLVMQNLLHLLRLVK